MFYSVLKSLRRKRKYKFLLKHLNKAVILVKFILLSGISIATVFRNVRIMNMHDLSHKKIVF